MVSREAVHVVGLCLLWYVVSSSNNVIGKMLLSEFPFPMTVTMVQLTSITVYSGPFFNLWGVRRCGPIAWPYYMRLIVPLALGKFLASVSSHVSIWKVPVSYAHTGEHICCAGSVKWVELNEWRGVCRCACVLSGAVSCLLGYDDGTTRDAPVLCAVCCIDDISAICRVYVRFVHVDKSCPITCARTTNNNNNNNWELPYQRSSSVHELRWLVVSPPAASDILIGSRLRRRVTGVRACGIQTRGATVAVKVSIMIAR